MTAWRIRLAEMRAQPPASIDKHVDAVSADGANSPFGGAALVPIGTIGAISTGIVKPVEPAVGGKRDAVAIPSVNAVLTEAGRLPPEHIARLQRPPAWSRPEDAPTPGAWCGCCGRFTRSGGRWWCKADAPSGWCCWTCHPPPHLLAAAVLEVRT